MQFFVTIFYLDFDQKFEIIIEKINQLLFIWAAIIKYQQNRLEVFNMDCKILSFFKLILSSLSHFISDIILKNVIVSKILLQKNFKLLLH